MTPNLLRELQDVHLSCRSPSSVAVATSNTKQHSSPTTSNSLVSGVCGGRAIDRYSPHLRDPLRSRSLNPLLPQPHTTKPNNSPAHNTPKKARNNKNKKAPEASKSTNAQLLVSPASSRRCLLNDESRYSEDIIGKEITGSAAIAPEKAHEPSRFQSSEKIEEISVVLPAEVERTRSVKVEKSNEADSSSSSTTTTTTAATTSRREKEQQVVVLRVSLHCKGCEGKVRKHISKMEGVTSFTTDLANKKVTVVGDVTPLGVLNSISKVKNAQLWPPKPPPAYSHTNLHL